MRLAAVRRGNRWPNRLFVGLINLFGGAPDVVKTINYRSGYFGSGWSDHLHDVMRGPSDWQVGERELFAAYTSHLNQCPF